MSRKNFPACFAITLKHEGGYVDHPRDPGGATNMGIIRATLAKWRGRAVSKQEVRDLSQNEAAQIYRRNYWDAVKGDALPDGMDLVAYDGGVNSGPRRGAQWLQKGLGVSVDGKIGNQTLTAALNCRNGVEAIQIACAARMGFLRGLRTFSTFGRGWSRRVAGIEAEAVAMYTRDRATVEAQVEPATKKAKQGTAAAAGSGGAGGASVLAELPDVAVYGIVAMAVVLAILFIAQSAHNRHRSDAYVAKSQEMTNG
ncbi:glycoside hydrolase family 108 protein [Pseudooceanicola nitratireducens]|uniref:glycoside hydrolase family 108 protein n=1 Tax=Pseudooceanicola nitratireducens TaxID=517719 RepID=UPI003C7D3249